MLVERKKKIDFDVKVIPRESFDGLKEQLILRK